jgi:hypothetical protein
MFHCLNLSQDLEANGFFAFSGLVCCGHGGHGGHGGCSMTGQTQGRYVYYRCTGTAAPATRAAAQRSTPARSPSRGNSSPSCSRANATEADKARREGRFCTGGKGGV